MPKYSFVLPAYKARFFREALDSILSQTYKDFELIIVNDASPEDLESIVNSYDDPRIRYYVNKENIGGKDLVAQWNHCLEYATGEYIILASDDDVYHLEYLEKMNALVEKYPDVNVFRPRVQIIDKNSSIKKRENYLIEKVSQIEFFYSWLLGIINSGIPYYIFKREALNALGGFKNYPMAWLSDDATVLLLSQHGVVSSTETLFSFRQSGYNISSLPVNKETLNREFNALKLFYADINPELQRMVAENGDEEFYLDVIRKTFCPHLSGRVFYAMLHAPLVTLICNLSQISKLPWEIHKKFRIELICKKFFLIIKKIFN